MDDTRRARLSSRVQHELSDLLMRGEIKDHRVTSLVSFSYVKLAKDGSTARVGVSSFLDHSSLERAVEGLNSAAGYLQGRIGRTLKIRATPHLHFVADHSIEEGQAIIDVINTLDVSPEAPAEHDESDSTSR